MNTPPVRAGVAVWEVLVVLAILVLMAAILFPVFQKVQEHSGGGRRLSCQSNLKQLGWAYVQYAQDADDKFPTGANAAGSGWAGKLYPYVKAVGCYHCPNDPAEGSHVSYAQNQNLTSQPLGILTSPAATVELYETTTLNCDPSTPETISATGLSAPQNSTRHDHETFGLNFLAADGHAKLLKPGQVSHGLNAARPKKRGAYILTFAVQ